MEAAPFLAELADGPDGGEAVWARTDDGIRIRLGYWPEGTRGTVLILNGRAEYIEKYGRTARDLTAAGYAVATLDWRGQGMADRLTPDPMLGHVGAFADYQRDLAALMAFLRDRDAPQPFYMIAHSMGGAIGLRALIEGQPIRAAAFSAPMWGIGMSAMLRPFTGAITWAARRFGRELDYAPGTSSVSYLSTNTFATNLLTTHRDTFAFLQHQVQAEPRFALGGPSIHWGQEALKEIGYLQTAPRPKTPAFAMVGTREMIVVPRDIARLMSTWPGGRCEKVDGAAHEILMEGPLCRARFLDASLELFRANP